MFMPSAERALMSRLLATGKKLRARLELMPSDHGYTPEQIAAHEDLCEFANAGIELLERILR